MSPACAPLRLADVSPMTTMLLEMIADTSRPIATPIESSGNAVIDIGKYQYPAGPGAACMGTPPRVTRSMPMPNPRPSTPHPPASAAALMAASATAGCNGPKL